MDSLLLHYCTVQHPYLSSPSLIHPFFYYDMRQPPPPPPSFKHTHSMTLYGRRVSRGWLWKTHFLLIDRLILQRRTSRCMRTCRRKYHAISEEEKGFFPSFLPFPTHTYGRNKDEVMAIDRWVIAFSAAILAGRSSFLACLCHQFRSALHIIYSTPLLLLPNQISTWFFLKKNPWDYFFINQSFLPLVKDGN